MPPEISILVPNFRTLELTRLCLQLLREHTDPQRARILVIDNDSRDASTEFLRSVEGIELIERRVEPPDEGIFAHARALDLALEQVDTPYVLSIHTDTLVLRDDWLDYLLAPFRGDTQVAGVGSWKLEVKPWYRRASHQLESIWRPILGKAREPDGEGSRRHYLRSHCAMYRTDVLREQGLTFSSGNTTAGRTMHFALEDKGYRMVFLPPKQLLRYMVHLNHATLVLNPEIGGRARTVRRGQRRMARHLRDLGLSFTPESDG